MPGPFNYLTTATIPSSGLSVDFRSHAPVSEVTISFRGNLETLPALLDSGASRTVIPLRVANALRLIALDDEVSVTFGSGESVDFRMYLTDLRFLGWDFTKHAVIGMQKRNHVTIGREILNLYKTTLDGPNLQFSIE